MQANRITVNRLIPVLDQVRALDWAETRVRRTVAITCFYDILKRDQAARFTTDELTTWTMIRDIIYPRNTETTNLF